MTVIVVDDERVFDPTVCAPHRVDAEHYITSTDAFRRILKAVEDNEVIDELWLDHDLGGEDTTRDLVMMMCEDASEFTAWPVRKVYVHSANPIGREWLWGTLDLFYDAVQVHSAEAQGLIKA